VGFHRIVQTPITLHDGVRLPAGTHICIASYPTLLDSSFASNAKEFDGFRYYKKRQEAAEAQKHQYAMTDKNHLHFGHGKFACPGRFFASNELKMILVILLLKYDFKFPEGQGRPANLNADEFLYADPAARLMMKRRSVDQSMLAQVR
jgi:cytochrome P450